MNGKTFNNLVFIHSFGALRNQRPERKRTSAVRQLKLNLRLTDNTSLYPPTCRYAPKNLSAPNTLASVPSTRSSSAFSFAVARGRSDTTTNSKRSSISNLDSSNVSSNRPSTAQSTISWRSTAFSPPSLTRLDDTSTTTRRMVSTCRDGIALPSRGRSRNHGPSPFLAYGGRNTVSSWTSVYPAKRPSSV